VSRRRHSLSASAVRRIALAAQGFGTARPDGAANLGHVKRAIDRLGLLQIDSVNVLARASSAESPKVDPFSNALGQR